MGAMPVRTKCFSLGLAAALLLSGRALQAMPLADSVVSFTGGSGFGVDGSSIDGENGEGVYAPAAVTALDGIILSLGGATGTPGTITMRFTSGEIVDGNGADLRLYDTHFFLDGFNLDISPDGTSFTNAFFFPGDVGVFACSPSSPCAADVDISGTGLSAASYLRITAAGSSGQGYPEAYTLDAVEALNFRSFSVSEPGTLALLGIATAGLLGVRRREKHHDCK
jgi:hypothetical protein